MLNGMLWIVRSGAQWRELPAAYGLWQSVYARFSKWRDDGTLEAVFHALSGDADMENLSVDATCVKVHESANDGEKQRIFQRFYRSEAARSDRNHFGLGLSTASEIVSSHHGRLWVEDNPHGGAMFILELPVK